MIEPMKKYSFLIYHKGYESFLEELRKIGLVHVNERQSDVSDEVKDKYDLLKQISSVLNLLQKREIESQEPESTENGEKAFEEVQNLVVELDQKQQQLNLLKKEITQVIPWGDFKTETIENLKDNGLHLKFFTTSQRNFDPEWEHKYPVKIISKYFGLIYFVLIHKEGEEIEIDAEEMRPPERPVSELKFYQNELEKDIIKINEKFDYHAAHNLEAIKKYYLSVTETVDYKKVVENTKKEAEEKVMLFEGWAPENKTAELDAFLEKNNILYIVESPGKEDDVPVLLKNKKFAKNFESIGELYSLPKYGELDLVPFFAPFYMLFFGFCLGDAGYGILMAIAAIFAKKKVQKELKQIMNLVFYLGLSTILFGIIGGTFFGIPLYETNLPVYSELALKFEQRDTNINNLLFNLSLILGGVQILFGLILKTVNEIKQLGISYAIGTMGWVVLLIGLAAIFLISRIGEIPIESLMPYIYVLLAVSGIMILLLNNLKRNILMNFGVGLWGVYNMVTGLLGDMLSYIRLFALGISSAIMGYVFNSLAVEMSGNIPVISIIIMVIILLIGHSINLFMSGLGSFVHPVRLTFVEFYKNAGFSGGGKKYNPFRKLT